jgi:nitrilase
MSEEHKSLKVAAAQATPIYLNKEKSIQKACELIAEAGGEGAKLIVFPEVFIPGYPDWVWLVANSKAKELNEYFVELHANAISIPDTATDQLCEAARKAGIYVAIGIHEKNSEASNASLYNSLLYIDDNGQILGVHRKLIPTGGERLIWAQGDGDSLLSFNTGIGRIGGLICWENLMPLARQSMYNTGIQILIAPTWDKSEHWLTSMKHIAREGGMFVISCCMTLRTSDIPDRFEFKKLYPDGRDWVNTGNSCIVGPKGNFIVGPVEKREEILFAELDLREITASKRMFDVSGHYARPDVFNFSVNRST